MSEQSPTAWIRLFHPCGTDIKLPIAVDRPPTLEQWQAVFASVDAALAAGFLAQVPGLEEGEAKDQVGYVARKVQENRDGTQTDLIDLYSVDDSKKYKFLTVYLNTASQANDFETVSGLKVRDIPVYIGEGHIKRGTSRQLDALVVPVPRPFPVAFRANPKFNQAEADAAKEAGKVYKVTARIFSRWPTLPETTAPAAGPKLDPARVEQLEKMLTISGTDRKKMLDHYHVRAMEDLSEDQYIEARDRLKARIDGQIADARKPEKTN